VLKPKADVPKTAEVQDAPGKVEAIICASSQGSSTASQASKEQGEMTTSDVPEYVETEAACGDAKAAETLIECTEDEAELFLNTCRRCGETLMLIIDGGEDFVCEEAGRACGGVAAETGTDSFATSTSDGQLYPVPAQEEGDVATSSLPLRAQLLQQVLAEELTALAAADLFLSNGEQPPKPSELDACREDIQRRNKERKHREKSEAAYEAAKANQKRQQRYVAGQLVEMQKGSKYLTEPKESAVEKAKTSISLFIQGSHRGGGHGEKEKKGPRS
jgi:hypothetical protein